MRKALWLFLVMPVLFRVSGCGEEHSLPQKFHENRIGMPKALTARYEQGDVILEWDMSAPSEVYYYIVTVSGGILGEERQYVVPGDRRAYTATMAWTDSFYTFYVQAADTTNFVSQRSNVDTVFIPTQ